MANKYIIRWMTRKDMAEVLDIEYQSTKYSLSNIELNRILRQRNAVALVCECENRILGYCIYEMFKQKLKLLRFVVYKDNRRQGVGTVLIKKMQARLTDTRRNKLTFPVSEYDLDLHLFLRSQSFTCTKIIKNQYLFEYSVLETPSFNYQAIESKNHD